MGIGKFQKFIKENYSKSIKAFWLSSYDNLYIDINHVLHHVCYLSSDISDLRKRFMDYLNGIITTLKPTKRLILAADGPAPLAKFLLQRKRRFSSNNNSHNNHLHLSPGTKFMMNLTQNINSFVLFIKEKYNIEVITLIPDHDEGEIKIRKCIDDYQKMNNSETHIVYSGDSDTILLLFATKYNDRVYQALSKTSIISIGELYNIHVKKYCKSNNMSVKEDFVFLNLLIGNDYIPKTLYLTLDNIWDSYKVLTRYKKKCLINYDNHKVFIEPVFLHDLIYLSTKNTKKHFKKFALENIKDSMYDNYTNGLYWCFDMYMSGSCNNYNYYYKSDMSPHYIGVMMTLMANNIKVLPNKETHTLCPELYGILLIPLSESKDILSERQMTISKKIYEKYPEPDMSLDLDKIVKYYDNIEKTIPYTDNKDNTRQDYKPYTSRQFIKKLF